MNDLRHAQSSALYPFPGSGAIVQQELCQQQLFRSQVTSSSPPSTSLRNTVDDEPPPQGATEVSLREKMSLVQEYTDEPVDKTRKVVWNRCYSFGLQRLRSMAQERPQTRPISFCLPRPDKKSMKVRQKKNSVASFTNSSVEMFSHSNRREERSSAPRRNSNDSSAIFLLRNSSELRSASGASTSGVTTATAHPHRVPFRSSFLTNHQHWSATAWYDSRQEKPPRLPPTWIFRNRVLPRDLEYLLFRKNEMEHLTEDKLRLQICCIQSAYRKRNLKLVERNLLSIRIKLESSISEDFGTMFLALRGADVLIGILCTSPGEASSNFYTSFCAGSSSSHAISEHSAFSSDDGELLFGSSIFLKEKVNYFRSLITYTLEILGLLCLHHNGFSWYLYDLYPFVIFRLLDLIPTQLGFESASLLTIIFSCTGPIIELSKDPLMVKWIKSGDSHLLFVLTPVLASLLTMRSCEEEDVRTELTLVDNIETERAKNSFFLATAKRQAKWCTSFYSSFSRMERVVVSNVLFLQSFPNIFSGLADLCKEINLYDQELQTRRISSNATPSVFEEDLLVSTESEHSEIAHTDLEEELGRLMEPSLQASDSSNASTSILPLGHMNNDANHLRSRLTTSVHSQTADLSHPSNRPLGSGSAAVSLPAERNKSSEREESSNMQNSTTAADSDSHNNESEWSSDYESWEFLLESSETSDFYSSSQGDSSTRNNFISSWLFGEHRKLHRWREKDQCLYRCKDDIQRAVFGNAAPFPLRFLSSPQTELSKGNYNAPIERHLLDALSLISCMLNSSQFSASFPCFDETHFLKTAADMFFMFIGKEKLVRKLEIVRPSVMSFVQDLSFRSCSSLHSRKGITEEETEVRPARERKEGSRTKAFPFSSNNCESTQSCELSSSVSLSSSTSAREEQRPLGSLTKDILKEGTTWNCTSTTSGAPLGDAENQLAMNALSLVDSKMAETKAVPPERMFSSLENGACVLFGGKYHSSKTNLALVRHQFNLYLMVDECILTALIMNDDMLCGEYSYIPYWNTDESISCLRSNFSRSKQRSSYPRPREKVIWLLKCMENYWRAKRHQLCDIVAPRISSSDAKKKSLDRHVRKQKNGKKKQVLSFSSSSFSHHDHQMSWGNTVGASHKRGVEDDSRRHHFFRATAVNSSHTTASHRLPQNWRNNDAVVNRDNVTESSCVSSLTAEEVTGMNEKQTVTKANEEAERKAYARLIVEELLHSSFPILERRKGRFTFLPVIQRYLQYHSIHLSAPMKEMKENVKEKDKYFDQPFMKAESTPLHCCSTSFQNEDKKEVEERPRSSTLPPFSLTFSPHLKTVGKGLITTLTTSSSGDSKEERKVRRRALSCPSFRLFACECAMSRTSYSSCFSSVWDPAVNISASVLPDGGSSHAFFPSSLPVFSIFEGTKTPPLFPYRRCNSEPNVQDEVGANILPDFLRKLSSFNTALARATFDSAAFCCTPTFYSILSCLLMYHHRNLQVLCLHVAGKHSLLEKANKSVPKSNDTEFLKVKTPSKHSQEPRESLSADYFNKAFPHDRGVLDQHLPSLAFHTNPGNEKTPPPATFEAQAKDNIQDLNETANNEKSRVIGESVNHLESRSSAFLPLQNSKLNDDAEKSVTDSSEVKKEQNEGIFRDAKSILGKNKKQNHGKTKDTELCTSTLEDGEDDEITPLHFGEVLLSQFYSIALVTNSLLRCLLLSLTPGLRSSANLMYLWQRMAIVGAEQRVKENNQKRKEADFSIHQQQQFSDENDSQNSRVLASPFSSESGKNSPTPLLHIVVHRENLCPPPLRSGMLPSETFREDYLRSRRIEKLSWTAINLISKYCDEETVRSHGLPKRGKEVELPKGRIKPVHESPVEISKKAGIQRRGEKPGLMGEKKKCLMNQLLNEKNKQRRHTCVHCRIQKIVVRLVRKLQNDGQPSAHQNAPRERHPSFLDRDDFELLRGSKKENRGKNGADRSATTPVRVDVKEVMQIDLPTLGPPSCCRISLFDHAISEKDGLVSLLPLSEALLAEPHRLLFSLLFPIPVKIMSHPSATGVICTALLLCMREAKLFGGSSAIHRLLRRVKELEAAFCTYNSEEEVKSSHCRCKSSSGIQNNDNRKQASKVDAASRTQQFGYHQNERVIGTPLAPRSACSSHCQKERKESIPISLRSRFSRDVHDEVEKESSKRRRSEPLSPLPSSSSSRNSSSRHSLHLSRETPSSGPLSLPDNEGADGRRETCFFKKFFLILCFWVGNVAASQRIIAHMYLSSEVAFLDYKIVALYLLRILPQYFFSSESETKM